MSPHDLLKINVNDHIEKKNGLSYLSWAWAWREALKADQNATFDVQTFEGKPYMDVNGTGLVWVTVTMFGQPRTYKNKPILNPDAFAVNTAIMRCMTKALALHGLAIYIYAGDDLPDEDGKTAPTPQATAPMGELTRKEDGPKYEKIIAKPKKTIQPTEWDPSDESRKFFTESMIEWTSHCTSVAGLNSYWKSNEIQLDSLKVTHPSLYEEVLSRFKTLKLQLSEETK